MKVQQLSNSMTLACLFLLAGSSAIAEETNPDFAGVIQRASQITDAARSKYNLPSISVALVHDTEIIFSRTVGFADLKKETPATNETVYRVASITKLITATAMVKLAAEGVLRLDDPVSKYIPEYTPRSRFKGTQPTTLSQLAKHMSGLPRSSYSSFHSDIASLLWVTEGKRPATPPAKSRAEFLESLRHLELQYPPNELYGHYSNLGFTILGLALEEASGLDFVEYVTSNILQPLNMTHSGFERHESANSNFATGYIYPNNSSEPLVAPISSPNFAVYAGGLYSTAEDLCQFLALQFQNEEPGGAQVISGDGLRMMQWEAMDWAFHWDAEHPSLSHGGGLPGFSAHVVIVPGLKLGVVALTNTMNTLDIVNPAQSVARDVIRSARDAIAMGRVVKRFNSDSVIIDNYIGVYVLGDGGATITISRPGEELFYSIRGYPQLGGKILPLGPNEFYFAADTSKTYKAVFETDNLGKAQALLVGFHRFRLESR